MASHKSTNNRFFSYYLLLLSSMFFMSFILINNTMDMLLIVLSFLPLLMILQNIFIRKYVTTIGPFIFFAIVLLGIFYRVGRGFFPSPQINGDSIIGYAHFYGYPLYFDHVVFALFIIIPIVGTIYFMIKHKVR